MAEADKIDDYQLLTCIATGNTTQVWEVRRHVGARSLAMKLLLPEAFKVPQHRRSLKHEFAVGKGFEHPNLIKIFDLTMTRTHGYFTMEFFGGANLKTMIRSELPFLQANTRRLMECLAQALAYMHEKNWVHKDLKPDNVIMNKAGEVRLIDFTLASRPGNVIAHTLTKKSRVVIQGTRTYIAPELVRRERLTPAADIYSLGVMLFEMLTGNPPFRTAKANDLLVMHVREKPPAPSEIESNVTPEADELVLRMLAKRVKDRPASMNEVFAAVRSLKFFKQDPMEYFRAKRDAFRKSDAQKQNLRLNSRMDAERTAEGGPRPAPRKAKLQPKPQLPVERPAVKAAASTQPPVQQPQFPQYPPAGYPGMPMPGYPMMQPGMPMPGYPMMQPGMPFPMGGYPAMPGPAPGMMPQYPGQPPVPYPQGPLPMGPSPVAPIPTAPQPTPAQSKPLAKEDLPLASIDDLDIE